MTPLTKKQTSALSVTLKRAGLFDPAGKEIKYVGELPRSILFGSEYHTWGAEHRQYFAKNNLPILADPVQAGWRPPYFDDPAFLSALDKPIGEMIEGNGLYQSEEARLYQMSFVRLHNAGIHYAGQLFTQPQLQWNESMFFKTKPPIRKIMYAPPEWQPPKGIPEEWRPQYDKFIDKCIQLWERHPQRIVPKGEAFGEDVPFEIQSMFAAMGIFDTQTIATMPEQDLAARLHNQPGQYPGMNYSNMRRPYELVEGFVRKHRPDVNATVFPDSRQTQVDDLAEISSGKQLRARQ